MKRRRVVITGLGVVAPNGIGKEEFWRNIKDGKSGIKKITSFDTSPYPIDIAGEISNFNPRNYMDEKIAFRTPRFGQFALVATQEAITDAKLNLHYYKGEKVGVAIGTSMGGLYYALDQHNLFIKEGPLSIDSFITSIVVPSAATRAVSLAIGAKGSCMTFSSSCAASADAIGYGLNLIRKGEVDIMLVGGAESPINPPIFAGFCLSRILSSFKGEPIRVPRPFDLRRDGTAVGEGAAILVLEELKHAQERGAHVYTEIGGYASTCDSYHIVNPDPEGNQGVRAIVLALKDAGIKLEEVNYINAHGTGTVKNDQIETLIVKKVFKDRIYNIPISSTKSMTGHLLGASAAIEAAICTLAMQNNVIPPTINYQEQDPQCDLDYVPNKARHQEVNIAISNSFGFGGFNAVLVIKKI